MNAIMTRALLAALATVGALALNAEPASAWSQKQLSAPQRYMACKIKLQAHPPCNENWTRQCARRCHARYI